MNEEELLYEFVQYLEDRDQYHHFLAYIDEQTDYNVENAEQLLNEIKNEQSY